MYTVGMLTCYDLRFAEPALLNRERGAEIITYPSAFATRTGMAHWGESAGVLPSMSLWILPNPSLRPNDRTAPTGSGDRDANIRAGRRTGRIAPSHEPLVIRSGVHRRSLG